MNNKFKCQKTKNRYRFQTFSERISQIDVDVFHKVKHPYEEEDEEDGTYYSRSLKRWKNDNFAPEFTELCKVLPHDIYSLPQLIAQQHKIVNVLVNHIKSCDLEALPPALELLVAIAQDLRKEFYPFFHPLILGECVKLLDSREPEQIECVFNCLARLFMYLWAPIVKNINLILPDLLPLLSSSKPKYINEFAAESFAFVARKVKDKPNFVKLSLKNVKKNRDELLGLARLFFEVVRSVGQQFHSCAEEFLTLLLEELDNRKWSDLLLNICENLMSDITKFVSAKTDVSVIWKSFMNVGNKFSTRWRERPDEHNASNLFMILKIAEKLVTSKEIILRNPGEFMPFLVQLGADPGVRKFNQLHEIIVDLVSYIIVHKRFSQNATDVIIKIIKNIEDETLLVRCCESFIQCPQFELLVFAEFLVRLRTKSLNKFLVQFLVKIIWLKTKFSVNENHNLQFYFACLKSAPDSFTQYLLDCIPDESKQVTSSCVEEILYSILILYGVEQCRSTFCERVDYVITQLCRIIDDGDEEHVAKMLYSLLMVFQYRLSYSVDVRFDLDIISKTAMKYVNSCNYLCSLRLLHVILTQTDLKSFYSQKITLINNLSSPFHKVRLFTLQVLVKMESHEIFETMLKVESMIPSIENYREKLQLLQKLEYNEQFASYSGEEFVDIAVIKFLFGNLYINFQYLWEPTQKLIRSHLENSRSIWSTMEYQLNEAVANSLNSVKMMENFAVNFEGDFIRDHFYDLNGVDDRPDFYNFRCLLLETLLTVRNVEFTSKHFAVDLFLNFIKSEYKSSVFEHKTSVNVKKMEEDLSDIDNVDVDDSSLKFMKTQSPKVDQNLNKLLILFLKLMNNFPFLIPQNLRSEVLDIYFDLLTNRNSEIQQLVVAYICKSRTLSGYNERLQQLTKESTMKGELLNMKLDLNSDILPEQDKPQIMKIVLKILYGKVKKKCSSQLRDSIFEFLAGCDDNYIVSFFDLFFSCKSFRIAVDDSTPLLSYLSEEVDLENTVSPSCLSSYATTVVDLFNRCGKLLKPRCLTYLLRVLFKIMANWRIVSAIRSEVHPGYYSLLNKIRVTSFTAISYFIDNFQYDWSKDEMEVLLQLFVDPWIEKIPEECLQSPNQAMRLLIIFTNNTRYFPILARRCGIVSPVDAIVRLLNSDKTYFNVKNTTVEIIERLLTLEGDIKERSQLSSTKIDLEEFSDLFYLLDEDFISAYKRDKHFGKVLLQPHIPTLLCYLQKQLSKKFVKLDGLYMLILQNISAFALDETSSCRLLDLLMPTLRNKATADDDVVLPLLQVILDLFKTFQNYNNFEKYLLQVGQLFNVVTSGIVRRTLCDLVKYISSKTGWTLVDGDLIQGLNSNDKRRLDQPDYAGRMETFQKIKTGCESGELSLYSGVFIVYNCFHCVKTEKDMGLRDHAGLCLKRICPALCTKFANSTNELNFFLNVVLLPLIKEGIESKNENYQLESILLLGHMVRECSSAHFVFNNLYPLCDPKNLDNDFFENIYHLQNFRRIKALKRFNEIMSLEVKPMQPYSLMFLHPLISQYLLSPKFSTEHSLINNAIEALKIICYFFRWRQYEKTLKLYIFEMRKNVAMRKQAIRIVSTILDAFHFDISQASDEDFQKATVAKVKTKTQKDESDEELMEVDEPEQEKIEKHCLPVIKRINVLCRSDAVRVYRTIKTFLIPSLDNAFMVYEDAEKYHKLSKKNSNNDKEELAVMSIPVSFAAIKLLKRLPPSLLESYICRVFLKLCTYLQSRLPSIRLIARETMQNILLEVGPSYLPRLLSEMTAILTKGFQVHVLVFTSHAVLEKLESTFTKGVIDPCIDRILEICIVDLFGKLAEEKEVEKISNKIPETKGNISYNMLRILAEYASENRILDLVLPFKEIIANHMSSKKVNRVSRCLHYITTGLVHNKFISAEDLLIFSYGVSHDCIPMLVAERDNEVVRIEPETPFKRPDSFLIPEEPRHMVVEKRKICIRTNAHVIIAFGLEILSVLLKRETIVSSVYLPYLDPFVPLINDCLQSQHIELVVLSLKCLSRLLLRDLPSMKDNVRNILHSVFTLLGKYSISGTTTKNEELVMAATKVAQVLMQPKLNVKIPSDQLQILLFVVEDLLKNRTHYATGYSVLGTIISRKFENAEFNELMQTTANLSIQSYHDDMRYKAQDALCRHLMYYASNKKYRHFVKFYVSQLEYAEEFGRKSALEILKKLIDGIRLIEQKASSSIKKELYESRLKIIKSAFLDLCPLIFVQLSFRLSVDDSSECKKMAASLISDIISFTATKGEGNDLFNITLAWLKDKKIRDRRLAVQLLGLFVIVEKEKFFSKLDTVLPLMSEQFFSGSFDGPGKYVRAPRTRMTDGEQTDKDHLLFQVLQFYSTVFNVYPKFLTTESNAEHIWRIGENCQMLLGHAHEWVRLEAARVLATIFKSMDASEIASIINNRSSYQPRFLHNEDAKPVIKRLCMDLCDQLAPGADVREELLKAKKVLFEIIFKKRSMANLLRDNGNADALFTSLHPRFPCLRLLVQQLKYPQTAVNLIFLAEVLQDVKYHGDSEKLSLRWLMKKISKECALEVVRSPFKYSVRCIVFNYFAALTKKLRTEKLSKILPVILLPLLRELSTTDEQGVEIRRVAKEVINYYRHLEAYDKVVTEVQRILDIKRAKRKRQKAQMSIIDPERAARRKIKIQLKKKEQRKRRLEKIRKRKFRNGKKKPVVINDD